MVRIIDVALYYLPVATERTLSFGARQVDRVDVVRIAIHGMSDPEGSMRVGWADVPLNLGWAWPEQPLEQAERVARQIIELIRAGIVETRSVADPFFWHRDVLEPLLRQVTVGIGTIVPEPVAMMCLAPFDIAYHDLFGQLAGVSTYDRYGRESLAGDLAALCADGSPACRMLRGVYPEDITDSRPRETIIAWHLVGLTDPVDDLVGWVKRDGLTAVKVKLNGFDMDMAMDRLHEVRAALRKTTVCRVSVDFNGTASSMATLKQFIQASMGELPQLTMIEQPFAAPSIDRLPDELVELATRADIVLSLDESIVAPADVITANEGGWDGVVVKTCKTQTRALTIAALAHRLGLRAIVQDLTNPMLALIAHLQLASYLDTGWGAEVNASQYYPSASQPEAMVHPGAFRRIGGTVSTASFTGPGLGYRIEEINRTLPPRAA